MIVQERETKSAGQFAWWAAQDARMRSAVYATTFKDAQKVRAERMRMALEMVYSCTEVSVTYCKKWIRVKVHNGTVRDRRTLATLEQGWASEGITRLNTPQGIIYHVV